MHVLQQLALTYQPQRCYQDEANVYDRLLALIPTDGLTQGLRTLVAVDWKADLRPYQTLMSQLLATDPEKAAEADDINYTICERSPEAFARGLKHYPRGGSVNNAVNYPHAYFEGVVAICQGDPEKARSAFQLARAEIAAVVERAPDFAPAISFLGMIDAGLGRKEDALREGRHACELCPPSKDALDGVALAVNLAQIYVWTAMTSQHFTWVCRVVLFPDHRRHSPACLGGQKTDSPKDKSEREAPVTRRTRKKIHQGGAERHWLSCYDRGASRPAVVAC